MSLKIDNNLHKIVRFIQKKKEKIFSSEDLGNLLEELKDKDWIGKRGSIENLLEKLAPLNVFTKQIFTKEESQKHIRYTTGAIDDLSVIQTLASKAFYTHHTALALNGIIINSGSRNIYQTIAKFKREGSSTVLTQEGIDATFALQQRQPSESLHWKTYKIFQLHREISQYDFLQKTEGIEPMYFTDLEKTMLDITVRPAYAGGGKQCTSSVWKS